MEASPLKTPEEQARELIDLKLAASGWIVQAYRGMDLGAGTGLAISEFPGAHGDADYLLYVDGKAIGVVDQTAQTATRSGTS